jgi:hypothetical protein
MLPVCQARNDVFLIVICDELKVLALGGGSRWECLSEIPRLYLRCDRPIP